MSALALTRSALACEPWRLWTGHLIHYDFEHLFFNVLAALPPLLLLRRRQWIAVAIWVAAAAPIISIAILAGVPDTEYRGASALVIGIWLFVPLINEDRKTSFVMLALVVTKLAVESLTPVRITDVSVPPLPLAHAAGAVAGWIGAAIFSRRADRLCVQLPSGSSDSRALRFFVDPSVRP